MFVANTVRVEKAVPPTFRTRLPWLRDTLRPAGETALLRFTVPEKPLMLVTVIVELYWPEGAGKVRLEGLADSRN